MKAVWIVALFALPCRVYLPLRLLPPSTTGAAIPAARRAALRAVHGRRCRDLYNVLRARTLPSSHEVVEGMRREYRCEEEEQDARLRYTTSARNDARRASMTTARCAPAGRCAVQASAAPICVIAAREAEIGRQLICEQSRPVRSRTASWRPAKKARTDLSVANWNDLRRFEDNVAARCRR